MAAPFAHHLPMNMLNSPTQRKTPVHLPPAESPTFPVIVFVTICAQQKKRILAHHDIHHLLRRVWEGASHWSVGRYVIMPDHIHLFCSPAAGNPSPLDGWISFWKSQASRRWPRAEEQPVWQRSCWDTELRHGESYQQKWQYVLQNPVRAGLCVSAEEWPFQGELNDLAWGA